MNNFVMGGSKRVFYWVFDACKFIFMFGNK